MAGQLGSANRCTPGARLGLDGALSGGFHCRFGAGFAGILLGAYLDVAMLLAPRAVAAIPVSDPLIFREISAIGVFAQAASLLIQLHSSVYNISGARCSPAGI